MQNIPNSLETEQQLLGAVILDESVLSEVATLDDDAFYNSQTRRVFQAIKHLADANEQITPLNIYNAIGTSAVSMRDIANWAHGLPFQMKVEPLIAILRDKQVKRLLIQQADQIIRDASEESDTGTNITSKAASLFQDIHSSSLTGRRPTLHIAEAMEESYERWDKMANGKIITVGTGIDAIDKQLTGGGFEKGMFHVIGARPAVGKTSFGLDMSWHNILNGNVTVFLTMELSREVLNDRFVAPLAGVPRWQIAPGFIDDRIIKKLQAVGEHVKAMPFYINAKVKTLSDMRMELNNVARQTGGKIDLIIVDFLTKMNGKGESYERITNNANGLAQFASDYDAAVVCLSQLGRKNVNRTAQVASEQGKVELHDFRGSGDIEELGRTILGLWGSDESNGVREVHCTCLKQGEGRTFDEVLSFDSQYMTFGVRPNLLRP